MKIAVCLLALISVTVCEKYTDRYDQINIKEVLDNGPLLEAYFKCIVDVARCTPEGKELKAHLREAIETECEKCTEMQKKKSHEVISHLIRKKNDYWVEICKKYDERHTRCAKYEKMYKN